MATEANTLHMLFLPFMAPGHMLPMLDIAKLFAARGGVSCTFLTTPANGLLIRPLIDHSIHLHLIPFPSTSLPEGCENVSSVPTQDLEPEFTVAVNMLRDPFARAIREILPDCVVADMFFPWSSAIAAELGIPRLVFYGTSFFSDCVTHSLIHRYTATADTDDAESVVIPGLPHRIEMFKSQLPNFGDRSDLLEVFAQMGEAEANSFGVVVNSFYELEPDYADHYRNVMGKKAWHIGPLSRNKPAVSVGSEASCMKWLDGKPPGSVVYVCFGSMYWLSTSQLSEIALGLEASGHPFIWVQLERRQEVHEERSEGGGMIIRGWAPQIEILNHKAVGGFVTHCGWNSCLEGIGAGKPFATWPQFGDQFNNERLVVDVLRVGVEVGVKEFVLDAEKRKVVEAAKVERAVRELMGSGVEAEERRTRARGLGEMARIAVEEGGSSYADMSKLIEELIMEKKKKTVGGARQVTDV